MASPSQNRPLDALTQGMAAHSEAQASLFQQIDDAVAAAHAELEQEREAQNVGRSELQPKPAETTDTTTKDN